MILLFLLSFGWLMAFAEYISYIPYSQYHKFPVKCGHC